MTITDNMSSHPTLHVPLESALDLIVRPVYDQSTPIVNNNGNPFGLPSNLEEQRESWRALVPCHRNSKESNNELFKISKLSNHAYNQLAGVPAYETQFKILKQKRRISVRVAQCLALILITEKGEGNAGQGELDYNWALCREVFGVPFTRQYRDFIRLIRPQANGYHDMWT